MSIKLKPITETSWLILGEAEDIRIGLLTQIRNEYVLIAMGEKKKFLDRKAVNGYFNEDIFKTTVQNEPQEEVKKDYYINSYPVDFDSPNEVIIKGTNLPLFSKKVTSDVYYSAGHYCLHFPKNWMPAYCPKLSTLEAYEYAGPFKSELEMRSQLTKLRKDKNSRKNKD
jgi:hypothetical protein